MLKFQTFTTARYIKNASKLMNIIDDSRKKCIRIATALGIETEHYQFIHSRHHIHTHSRTITINNTHTHTHTHTRVCVCVLLLYRSLFIMCTLEGRDCNEEHKRLFTYKQCIQMTNTKTNKSKPPLILND